MRRLNGSAKFILLTGWLIIACVLYFGLLSVNFAYITAIYLGIITLAIVFYFLINGSFNSISREYKELGHEPQAASGEPIRPNPLKMEYSKRVFWCDVVLIIGVVPVAIILADYMLMLFGVID